MFGTIVFWALILLGVPLVLGQFCQLLFLIGLSFIIGNRAKRLPEWLCDFIGGIATSLIAGLFSVWCGASFSLLVPIWLSILTAIYFSLRREHSQILPAALGIVVGYVLWVRS